MKVVVTDTSPINYLVLIDSVDILLRLYRLVMVPEKVMAELVDPGTPTKVMRWIQSHPDWVTVCVTREIRDASLERLDPGERAAISLAHEQGPNVLLLMDDAPGRTEASRRRIPTVGTLGVLRAAARHNLLDLSSTLDRLLDTNFRVSKHLVAELTNFRGSKPYVEAQPNQLIPATRNPGRRPDSVPAANGRATSGCAVIGNDHENAR